LQITTAGTEPDAAVSPAVAALLHAEGVDVTHHQPRCVSCKELAAAFRVISMGCDMSDLAPPGTIVEHWNDVSGPSAHLMAARDVIYMHVERLICGLNEPQS
jgi:protein-tyrosine-phosphatase